MLHRLKSTLREALPPSWQVPIKYWYAKTVHGLEPEMALLEELTTPGGHAIDVGANRGLYAFALRRLGRRVTMFEPNPVCNRALSAWAEGRKDIELHTEALSRGGGEGVLNVPLGDDGTEHDASGSLEDRPSDHIHSVTVRLAPLDSFGIRDAELVKIDVEGHEMSVIDGGVETIKASAPTLIVEIEQRHIGTPIASSFERIHALGYRGFFLDEGRRLRPIDAFDPARHQSVDHAADEPYINNFIFLAERRLAEPKIANFLRKYS